mmetsp:Transcript_17575/g.45424  ORF Transcript_17575/g.45424 Transcript_17575/m.45424 type:complete len:234 (-) Transcript_17575:11-712(-)
MRIRLLPRAAGGAGLPERQLARVPLLRAAARRVRPVYRHLAHVRDRAHAHLHAELDRLDVRDGHHHGDGCVRALVRACGGQQDRLAGGDVHGAHHRSLDRLQRAPEPLLRSRGRHAVRARAGVAGQGRRFGHRRRDHDRICGAAALWVRRLLLLQVWLLHRIHQPVGHPVRLCHAAATAARARARGQPGLYQPVPAAAGAHAPVGSRPELASQRGPVTVSVSQCQTLSVTRPS